MFLKPDPVWYCAVHLQNGVKAKTANLKDAHDALGSVGRANNRQAIIPMTKNKAGDPHTIDKSWNGGSMWWQDWGDINKMRSTCEASKAPGMILSDLLCESNCPVQTWKIKYLDVMC